MRTSQEHLVAVTAVTVAVTAAISQAEHKNGALKRRQIMLYMPVILGTWGGGASI